MIRRAMLGAIALIGAVACSDNPAAPFTGTTGQGQLAVLNALDNGTTAMLRLDGAALTALPEGQSGTEVIPAGAHQLQLVNQSGVAMASAEFAIDDGTHRTAVLSGSASSPVLLVTALDTAAVPVAGAAKLRVVHAAAGAPAMDAYVFDSGKAADSSARFVTNFSFGSGSEPEFPGYAIRPPGQYLVWLKATGTDNILVQTGPVTLAAGSVTSFVLAQNPDGTLQLRVVTEH